MRACSVLGALGVGLLLGLSCTDKTEVPQPPPTFQGLSGDVQLLRDDLGVVHIYGQTDPDVFYGAGYGMATDRLVQMAYTRRRALGRQSEIRGEAGVFDDTLVRIVDVPGTAAAAAELLAEEDPHAYLLLTAWVAGVNERIRQVQAGEVAMPVGFSELSFQPEPWTPADALAVGKLILFGNANQIEFELLATILRNFFPKVWNDVPLAKPVRDTFILPPEERPTAGATPLSAPARELDARRGDRSVELPIGASDALLAFAERMRSLRPAGSNNWALEGRLTDSGRSLIAGDPHQALRSPSLMWAHHMNSADGQGSIDVAGFGFVGTPMVQLGHNRHIAWTATTNYPDTMDLWDVIVSDGVAQIGGQEVPVETTTEEIFVKGEAEPRLIEVERIPGYGVVLPDGLSPIPVVDTGHRLLLNWPGLTATREGLAFYRFDTATSLDEFDAAVDMMEIGNFNFIAADQTNITYRVGATVPDRGVPTDDKPPYALLDANDPQTLWTGASLTAEQLPHSRGASRGWIASANNDPLGFTSDGRLNGDAYYFGVFFDPGTRATRVEEELNRFIQAGPVTLEQMKSLQTDTYSIFAEDFAPLIAEALAEVDTDPDLAEYQGRADLVALGEAISQWDRRMERDSGPALAFHMFMYFLTRRTLSDDFSLAFETILNEQSVYMLKFAALTVTERFEAAPDFMQQGRHRLVMEALDEAAAFLVDRYGDSDPTAYRWSDIHGTRFSAIVGDELDGGFVVTDGADGTVNVSGARVFDGDDVRERFESGGGAIYRMVVGFDEDGVPRAEINYPRGNSGDPASPHWDDTLDDWVEDRYRPMHFRTEDVEAASTEEIVLTPNEE